MNSSKLSYLKVWKLAFFYFVVVATGLLSLSGCQNNSKPSFIIIAIDRLAFNSFSCVDEKSSNTSGLSLLCKEALRFTHAYTTSVHPAAAVASILSGSYPYLHGVHRISDRVDAKKKLLSELADHQNYRTSFFSGSPSVTRKTGLSRGFDLFDDYSFLDKKNYLTNFTKQTDAALSWIKEDSDPFFTFIYNSELESLNEGESEISTFEKLDEKLAAFFSELKDQNQWESNYVVVVGLQGKSDYSRTAETVLSNLHSENTNITLFIKPPRQKGDEGINWKVDTPVNLADLGLSLMKTIDNNFLIPVDDLFTVQDFSVLWKKANVQNNLGESRKVLVETTNPWKATTETRYSIIFKNLTYIENQTDELYNTLNDGLETIDISSTATSSQNDFKNENRKLLATVREMKNQTNWTEFKTNIEDWIRTNREYWSKPNSRLRILDSEFLRYKTEKIGQPLTVMMLQNLMSTGKSEQLKELKLKIEPPKTLVEKEMYFDEARLQSINLSLENLWGIWNSSKNWLQSTFITEYQ